ncbi:MAG: autotransporter-associated beta strand repeat-containing protein [Planctomycetota bacterium]|nr:autotransporter-associated beta strand repeat-containing protein [Planctomycetota bacterium]
MLTLERLEPRLPLDASDVLADLYVCSLDHDHDDDFLVATVGHSDALLSLSPDDRVLVMGGSLDGELPVPSGTAAGLPELHSLPGAATSIYLDFDGHADLVAYDTDGDPTSFSAAEAAVITEAHRQTSVFFAMFDVNVTTVKPTGPFAWIVISGDIAGGSSNVGVFPNSAPRSWINAESAENRVSGIVHEIGHNFGLLHQSDYDDEGNLTSEYSNGLDALHGALMGVDYRRDVQKWFIGHPSTSPSVLQDDIAVIANVIKRYQPAGGDGFRADDHGGTFATATTLTAITGGRSASGIIERMTDVDTFSFSTSGTGTIISVVPTKPSGLDAKLEVFDAGGALIAASDSDANEQQLVLPPGTGTWYVSVSSHGNYGDLGSYDLSVNDLPAGWTSADIGKTELLGDAAFGAGVFTVAGAGAAVGGTSDAFRFAWQTLTGNGSITARVTQNQNTDPLAKAGIEIRESLAANSKHVAMVTTAARGPQLISRSTTGGTSSIVGSPAASFSPTWLRLDRTGNVITASRSPDGVSWTTVGSVTVGMSATVRIGLLTSAHDANAVNTARFDNISLTGNLDPPEVVNSLSPPAGVTVRQGGGASLVVRWQPVTGATGYVIERSENGVDFSSVFTAAPAETSWTDIGLPGALRYFYRVRSLGSAGQSAASAVVSEINRPSPVTSASIAPLSDTQLILNWRDTNGETGYRIERSTDNATYTQISTVAANVPSYTAGGLAAGTPYWFRISPITATGDGNPVMVTRRTTGQQAVGELWFASKTSSSLGIEWSATATATSYRIERSQNGTSFTTLASVPAGTLTYLDTSVNVIGRYYYRVVAIVSGTAADPSPTIFTAVPAVATLPAPWTTADVGAAAGEGATGLQSGKFILISSGTAIGGPADSFRFVSQTLVGDGTIVARVASLENTGSWPKAGLMIRESTDVDARQAALVVSPANGITWHYRHNIGGAGVVVAGPTGQAAPVWLKLVREGSRFTGFWSTDGVSWTEAGSTTIAMGTTAVIGLAATSDTATRLGRAEFTDVAVTIPTTDQVVTVAAGQTATEPGGRTHAGALIKRGTGQLILSGGNTYTGGTIVEGGELVIRDPAALGAGNLEIRANGRVTLDLGTGQLALAQMAILGTGVLDLASGSIRLTPGTYDLAEIRDQILLARGGGSWTGPGITTSTSDLGNSRAVGYRLLQDGSLVVGYAAIGDATMDGSVNVQDLIAISTSGAYGAGAGDAGWWQGDFNYDGLVNVSDLIGLSTSGLYGSGSYLPIASDPTTAAEGLGQLAWMAYAEEISEDSTTEEKRAGDIVGGGS